MPPTDRVRVFRIVEIVGTRERVEQQVRSSLHGAIAIGRRERVPLNHPDVQLTIAATTLGEFAEPIPDHEERLVHAEGVLEKIRRFAFNDADMIEGEHLDDLIQAVKFYDATWPRFQPKPAAPVVTDENVTDFPEQTPGGPPK